MKIFNLKSIASVILLCACFSVASFAYEDDYMNDDLRESLEQNTQEQQDALYDQQQQDYGYNYENETADLQDQVDAEVDNDVEEEDSRVQEAEENQEDIEENIEDQEQQLEE